jgi:hypothetical protein
MLFVLGAIAVVARSAESIQKESRDPKDNRRELWREIIFVLFVVIAAELLLVNAGGSSKPREVL